MVSSPSPTDRLSTPSALPARLPSLTGGRVILFVLAFSTHALGAGQFFKNPSINGVGTAVPSAISTLSLFFVLSGFVLTWQEPWKSTLGSFARKRLAKIFPSHIAIWAFTLAMIAVVGPMTLIGQTPLGPALANLFLVQAWIPDPTYVFSVYGINWSVSADIVFYISLPLLIHPILRIPTRHLWYWLVGLMAVIAVLPGVVMAAVDAPVWWMWAPLSFPEAYLSFFFPLSRLPEFLLGVILARMLQTGSWPRFRLWWAVAGTAALWLVMTWLPPIYKSSGFMAIAVCFFVPIVAMRDIEGRSRWLNRKPMVVLGDATYAAYLTQWPLLAIARDAIGPTVRFDTWAGVLLVLGLLVLNMLIGLVLYRFVERPVLRRFGRTRSERERARLREAAVSERAQTVG
ncbi:acyltransferase [Micromonospora sp. NPDC002296]|uniref:acyltransferase family protein n=1 Tax=Micromonospora sp. NPDC002296 TaxID=3154271 RepID=UPI0033265D22